MQKGISRLYNTSVMNQPSRSTRLLDRDRNNSDIGAKIVSSEATLEELAAYAENMGAPELPGSGKQERLEGIVNQVLFG